MVREPWELLFLAEPREIAGLRRVVRLHLKLWGLSRQREAVQLCVSELVTQVIRHAGAGTPTTLRLAMKGTCVRVEVASPESRVPPTRPTGVPEEEGERSLAVLGGMAERHGVLVDAGREIRWCEVATDLATPHGHSGGSRVTRAETLIVLYGAVALPHAVNASRLTVVKVKGAVIEAMVDLMRWADAHGYDADDILDVAQARFEAGL
ncbi:ATP-binding protein [Streptomyces sp. NPDC007863]|uniref:ATP-binding protein n=1 Tax=Streptomyces sp. NPDC007863 TaxID=3154894 RepID=UPI003409BE4E